MRSNDHKDIESPDRGKRLVRGLTIAGIAMALLTVTSGAAAQVGPLSTGGVIFYTAAINTIGAFFLINLSLKNRIGVYYSTLFAVMLVLVWALEGGLSSWAPALSDLRARSIALMIAFAGAALGFFTAERAIDPRRAMKRVRQILTALSAISVALIIVAGFWPSSAIALLANALLVAMFASQLLSTLTWQTLEDKPNRLPPVIAFILLIAIAAIIVIVGAGGSRDMLGAASAYRLIFALVSIPTMGAIIFALIDMRKSRDAALEATVKAAHKDAELSAALLEMEKNYSRARDIAAKRTRQLSTASHDIRQPIASMRAELDALSDEVAPANVERLDRILDHFDALTGDLARRSRVNVDQANSEQEAQGNEQQEKVPARLLFATLDRMFGAEAKTNGIDLRFIDSSASFLAPAVILMRISANLLSNAIDHSRATKILIGIRPRGDQIRLDIIDNGVGFADSQITAAFEEGFKGNASKGQGLGLSIVRELTADYDLPLNLRSVEGRGARFSILIPRT